MIGCRLQNIQTLEIFGELRLCFILGFIPPALFCGACIRLEVKFSFQTVQHTNKSILGIGDKTSLRYVLSGCALSWLSSRYHWRLCLSDAKITYKNKAIF